MKDHPLVKILRNSLFHITSLDAYKLIRADGFIRPNDVSRVFTYPQSSTSQCSLLSAVSLFDFAVPDDKLFEDDIHISYWFGFLVLHKPINLIIRFKREMIVDKIIPYE